MVNQEILGALKSAVARGQSVKRAILSLENTGYNKKEIEEASQALNQGVSEETAQEFQQRSPQKQKPGIIQQAKQLIQPNAQPQQLIQQPIVQQQSPQTQQQNFQQPQIQQQIQPINSNQTVSSYGQPKKPGGELFIVILVICLVVLLGLLATIFFFKEELLNFFSNIF